MSTDWELVRAMMTAAIDACERLESLGLGEGDRDAVVEIDGRKVSVFDILTGAWTYPETLSYQIVRQRHEAGADQPYVPETARILVNVARAAAETIGAGQQGHFDQECRRMLRWYRDAVPLVQQAVEARQPDL